MWLAGLDVRRTGGRGRGGGLVDLPENLEGEGVWLLAWIVGCIALVAHGGGLHRLGRRKEGVVLKESFLWRCTRQRPPIKVVVFGTKHSVDSCSAEGS